MFSHSSLSSLSLAVALCVACPLFTISSAKTQRVTKQINEPISSTKDHEPAETHGIGFGHGHDHGLGHGHGHGHGHDKYFQYAHVPDYGAYEFGYRRGNDYHFQERYEKAKPYGNFKTKVKWGDKYGGYGEHYWDYNHNDKSHHGHDGHGHGHGHGDGGHDGYYSEPVVAYEPKPGKANGISKRQNEEKKIDLPAEQV